MVADNVGNVGQKRGNQYHTLDKSECLGLHRSKVLGNGRKLKRQAHFDGHKWDITSLPPIHPTEVKTIAQTQL